MISDDRKHRRYLARLWGAANADADFCTALLALTAEDRAWLAEHDWIEPDHAWFVRINSLSVPSEVRV